MSHDRGCFKCHEDPSEYARCQQPDCPKRERAFRTTTRIKPPALNIVDDRAEKRPTCVSCGREQPLWGNCFRLASECPVRAAFAPGRPATRIISVNEPGYEIVMFINTDGGAQAVISRPGGKDPIDVLIAPPIPGRRIVVERKGDAFAVFYKDVQS
jgi:hypothetical protein